MEKSMLFFTERKPYMFEPKIDVQQAVAGLRKREKGLITYEKIMTSYKNTNLSNDMTFQRTFNGFYRIRRNEDWRKFYYENFEKWKNESTPTFPLILETLYRHTGRVECSFCSKMLATLCPDFPIWDSIVLDRLQFVCVVQTAKQNSKTPFLYTKIFSNGIRNFCLPEQQNHT